MRAQHKFLAEPYLYEKSVEVEGASLSALHYRQPEARGLIFFLHGNAGNLDSWLPDVEFYKQENYDLFMIDYRGYGKSTGKIRSQRQLEQDVYTAWQYVMRTYAETKMPVVIYGRSLGTYLATRLALNVDANLLVLVSPYTSMTAMARLKFPFLPTALLRYPLATDKLIGEIKLPVVLLHGSDDQLIPVEHARALLAKNANARLTVVPGANHADIHLHESYRQVLREALP